MVLRQIPKLQIGDLELSIPIIQGGMGVGISLSGLASAVANEGGIGVISTAGIGMLETDFTGNFREANKRALRREIKKAREISDGVIGVNVMVAISDYYDLLQVTLEEGADVVFLGAGLPLKIPRTLLPDSSGNYDHVPDAVVVEGPLAGGHLGFKKEQINDPDYALEKILPEVISVIEPYEKSFSKSIPVIAAGGVYTGTDIYRFIQMGAGGVQMATRFVATHECDASPAFKEAYVRCEQKDLTIINSPVGLPGRAIKNRFLEKISAGMKRPIKCPWQCLKTCDFRTSPFCICDALTNAKKGILEEGFAFAGANAYRINAITSVKELIDSLLAAYTRAASVGEYATT
jgi:NAD(P)H-dependent flavin oxidoreductase YrpB (nitropropane dioxygenase family)